MWEARNLIEKTNLLHRGSRSQRSRFLSAFFCTKQSSLLFVAPVDSSKRPESCVLQISAFGSRQFRCFLAELWLYCRPHHCKIVGFQSWLQAELEWMANLGAIQDRQTWFFFFLPWRTKEEEELKRQKKKREICGLSRFCNLFMQGEEMKTCLGRNPLPVLRVLVALDESKHHQVMLKNDLLIFYNRL